MHACGMAPLSLACCLSSHSWIFLIPHLWFCEKNFSQLFNLVKNCFLCMLWQLRTLRSRNILVFLLKSWSMATTWSVINWCSVAVFLIGIGFTCKKNSRKTFQRLLGRKPRHFCDQVKCSITQVFHTFPGISQNLPKNVYLKWYICLLTQKNHTL